MINPSSPVSKFVVAGVAIMTALSACSYPSQIVRLDPAVPQVDASAATEVRTREIVLVTRDARAIREIGRRAAGSGAEAPITTDTDVAALLETKVTEILAAKGFRVVPSGSPAVPTLEVELKELSYRRLEDGGKGKVMIQVVLGANVKNGKKTYRNNVRANREQEVLFEPAAQSNEKWINETFADALKELAHDTSLFSSLEAQ